jgi:hypothetical protein
VTGLSGSRLGNVRYHVTTLRELGLIEQVHTTPRRGALEHYYRARCRVRVEIAPLKRKPSRTVE